MSKARLKLYEKRNKTISEYRAKNKQTNNGISFSFLLDRFAECCAAPAEVLYKSGLIMFESSVLYSGRLVCHSPALARSIRIDESSDTKMIRPLLWFSSHVLQSCWKMCQFPSNTPVAFISTRNACVTQPIWKSPALLFLCFFSEIIWESKEMEILFERHSHTHKCRRSSRRRENKLKESLSNCLEKDKQNEPKKKLKHWERERERKS